MTSIAFLLAAALDLLLGDPHGWPHPVRLIGRALERLEPLGQAIAWRPGRRLFGLAVALGLGALCGGVVWLLTVIPYFGWVAALYFAWSGLALGQLLREGRKVLRLIEADDLDAARKALSWLVSRDTMALDRKGLLRTLAETLSENFCDGFVAPFFYLCVGGVPGMWIYKTISTMDSMWGYKTERFRDIGWAGARADDLLAFVPARLAALFLLAAGAVLGLPAKTALAGFRADARKMSSPNAGWPMAATAWLLQSRMGGEAVYFSRILQKPELCADGGDWNATSLLLLNRILLIAGSGVVLLGTLFFSLFAAFFS